MQKKTYTYEDDRRDGSFCMGLDKKHDIANGTWRKRTDGGSSFVSPAGVCDCGWIRHRTHFYDREKCDKSKLKANQACRCSYKPLKEIRGRGILTEACLTCDKTYWSICHGNGVHICPNCGKDTI